MRRQPVVVAALLVLVGVVLAVIPSVRMSAFSSFGSCVISPGMPWAPRAVASSNKSPTNGPNAGSSGRNRIDGSRTCHPGRVSQGERCEANRGRCYLR